MEIQIKRIEYGTELCNEYAEYIEKCPFADGKKIGIEFLGMRLTGWEGVFAVICENKIIGCASLTKASFFPINAYTPWINGIYVEEKYRGRGICRAVIEYLNKYAVSCGYDSTYLPCGFGGLFEKMGYTVVGRRNDYYDEPRFIYVRDNSKIRFSK